MIVLLMTPVHLKRVEINRVHVNLGDTAAVRDLLRLAEAIVIILEIGVVNVNVFAHPNLTALGLLRRFMPRS